VNWVLDADIRGFFDAIDHGWLVKFVEHRIADRRVVRLIRKWLNAGVLEDGVRTHSAEGTPQGGNISPLLANIYLHYVFDLWAHRWRLLTAIQIRVFLTILGFQAQKMRPPKPSSFSMPRSTDAGRRPSRKELAAAAAIGSPAKAGGRDLKGASS
jgi:hypothetical protein